MMKNIISSPYRKMKIFFILPVFAIVFYAFAKPDYQYSRSENTGNQNLIAQSSGKNVSGSVVQNSGTPLKGANVIVMGTTTGTITDENGKFKLVNLNGDAELVVTYIGFKSKVVKADFTSPMMIKMIQDTIDLNEDVSIPSPPPPPPPPPPPVKIRDTNGGAPPIVILDGVPTDLNLNTIDPQSVESITVLKDEAAAVKYGEKGRNGVIVITSKVAVAPDVKAVPDVEAVPDVKETPEVREVPEVPESTIAPAGDKDLFVVVEELPVFPGGAMALRKWIDQNIKYPAGAYKDKITWQVIVDFLVSESGKVQDARVSKSVNPQLDAEAKRVVGSMPEWKPGKQNGKPVGVQMKVAVNFKI